MYVLALHEVHDPERFRRDLHQPVLRGRAPRGRADAQRDREGSRGRGLTLKALPYVVLLATACESGGGESACEPIGELEMVQGSDYRPCAEEIVATLDSLRPHLQHFLADDDAARGRARELSRRLRTLVGQTGIERDYRARPGSEVVRWPDGETRAFNRAAFQASVMYAAALAPRRAEDVVPGNRDNFQQGVQAHDEARRRFHGIR